jgi:ubiquitin-conjugating enzyme E2 Q
MSGAICMELLTKDGWNPINDIESVIVSIRSLLVVGDGRLEAAANLPEKKYAALLATAQEAEAGDDPSNKKRMRTNSLGESSSSTGGGSSGKAAAASSSSAVDAAGSYTTSEAKAAYNHLSDYHQKKGWDTSGWWSRKG